MYKYKSTWIGIFCRLGDVRIPIKLQMKTVPN